MFRSKEKRITVVHEENNSFIEELHSIVLDESVPKVAMKASDKNQSNGIEEQFSSFQNPSVI